jgi:choline dehydrogenase-like flavoprotein
MGVLVLERGPRREPADLRQSDDPRYLLDVIDLVVTGDNIGYRTGKLVGGASIAMDGAHFRLPQRSFDVATDGTRVWPEAYSRVALDPYYDLAEAMLKVRQFPWAEIPKAGGLFAKMLDAAGASCDRARMNYADCLQCGFCAQGCIYNKKVTALQTYIPLAESLGAEFRAGADVGVIEPSGTGYHVRYTRDGEAHEVFGQRVIVACGGLHSPALLWRSSSYLPRPPENLR